MKMRADTVRQAILINHEDLGKRHTPGAVFKHGYMSVITVIVYTDAAELEGAQKLPLTDPTKYRMVRECGALDEAKEILLRKVGL